MVALILDFVVPPFTGACLEATAGAAGTAELFSSFCLFVLADCTGLTILKFTLFN
jgi:hypothetical protein